MKDLGILVVDDDTAFRNGMEVFLKSQGCTHVRAASCGEVALEMVKKEIPDVVLLDLYLPEMNGLKAIKEIHQIDKNIPIFVLTCEEDEEYRRLAVKLGAYDYLTKPIPLTTLFSYLELRLKGRLQPDSSP
jgi:DNA-binding response OmpR family regulator